MVYVPLQMVPFPQIDCFTLGLIVGYLAFFELWNHFVDEGVGSVLVVGGLAIHARYLVPRMEQLGCGKVGVGTSGHHKADCREDCRFPEK